MAASTASSARDIKTARNRPNFWETAPAADEKEVLRYHPEGNLKKVRFIVLNNCSHSLWKEKCAKAEFFWKNLSKPSDL
ncbi:MAG: hypothetical protein ACXQTY_05150 [Candidatus Methanogasteraceae archaeon]